MIEIFSFLLTVGIYLIFRKLSEKGRHHPLLSPPVWAMFAIIGVLLVLNIPYGDYFRGARPIHFVLGPATVGFALPIYFELARIRKILIPLLIALTLGSFVGIFSAVMIGYFFGLPHEVLLALAPKSVTTPIAMGIAEKTGGVATLTVVFVMITGICGAMFATTFLKFIRVHEPGVKGFAIGLSSHGLGTYRAFQISETAGAYAGLAMALNGLMTAILVPLFLSLIP